MTMHMAVMAMLESRGQANGMVEVRPVAYTNLALSVIFPTLAALMVGGRFYGRRLKRMTPGLDDWAILAALVLNFAQMTMSILRTSSLTGLSPNQVYTYLHARRRRPRRLRPPNDTNHTTSTQNTTTSILCQ